MAGNKSRCFFLNIVYAVFLRYRQWNRL